MNIESGVMFSKQSRRLRQGVALNMKLLSAWLRKLYMFFAESASLYRYV